MDCYQKPNTSPFVNSIDCAASSCPDSNLGNCYWDAALFDCLHDFSSSHQSASADFQVNTARTDLSSYGGSLTITAASTHTGFYSEEDDHEVGYGEHATLHYDDVEDAGPPARPQEFPTPYVHEGIRTTIRAMDHRTRNTRSVRNVLLAASNINSSSGGGSRTNHSPLLDTHIVDRAYLLKKKISKSSYGNRYLSVVLRRRSPSRNSSFDDENEKRPDQEDLETVEWESTDEFVTITVSPWNRAMRNHRRSLSMKREGIVHAIAAMQHVGNYHPHVMGLLGVFQDEQHLYCITPFHGGTNLQNRIVANREQGHYTPNETQARVIFKQLLQGLFHLQRKGVCHSNLSLENIYIDQNNQNLTIVDLGRSFRIPYNDPSNFGCLAGEAEGTTRRLLKLLPRDFATHPTENLMYLAPEIVENGEAFDGFAADLFSAGCILFVLLVGMAPFKSAHYWDAAYAEISSGNLKGLLASLEIHLSEEATGLLQNMFWRDPRDRLTLAQIMEHPWVRNQRFPSRTPIPRTSTSSIPRNVSSGHLSNEDTASTASSLATEKSPSVKASLSMGSRKTFTKALTGIFGSGTYDRRDNATSKSWTGLVGSSRYSKQRSGLGGLDSASSSVTGGSPASFKLLADDPAEEKHDPMSFPSLQLPSL